MSQEMKSADDAKETNFLDPFTAQEKMKFNKQLQLIALKVPLTKIRYFHKSLKQLRIFIQLQNNFVDYSYLCIFSRSKQILISEKKVQTMAI